MSRYNPVKPLLDVIAKSNLKVGSVKGIHSNVFDPESSLVATSSNGFYFTKIQADDILSLANVYNQFKRQSVLIDFVPSNGNTVDLSAITEDAEKSLLFLFSAIQVPKASTINFTVTVKDSDILVYQNNTKMAQGEGHVAVSMRVQEAERSLIQIIVSRKKSVSSSPRYFAGDITFNQDVPFLLLLPAPDRPEWTRTGSVVFGSLDNDVLSQGLILKWHDSPFVSGWDVERTGYQGLGKLVSFVASGISGYDLTFSGAHSPRNHLIVDSGIAGFVSASSQAGGLTTVNIMTNVTASGTWIGKSSFFANDSSIIASIDRNNLIDDDDAEISFVDVNVTEKMAYSYTLYAKSLFDEKVVSPPSITKTGVAFDDTPPGPITLWPNAVDAVTVNGNLVTVGHLKPTDPDLAGYRIYDSNDNLLLDLRPGNELFTVDGVIDPDTPVPPYFSVFAFKAQELQGFDVSNIVTGYTVTTYDFAGNELALEDGTTINFTLLVQTAENFTNFDHVSSPTSDQRRPSTIPASMWKTAIDLLDLNISKAGG